MKHIFNELIGKKARVKIKCKHQGWKLIPVEVLGFQINTFDFYHNKDEIKVKVSIRLLEALPKNSLTKLYDADSIPLSLLRAF